MKVICIYLELAVIMSGTLILARFLYTTELGGRIQRIIPDSTWSTFYERFGLEGAETTLNAEIIVWLVMCFVVSAGVVLVGSRLVRNAFRRR